MKERDPGRIKKKRQGEGVLKTCLCVLEEAGMRGEWEASVTDEKRFGKRSIIVNFYFYIKCIASLGFMLVNVECK